jgi:3-oxoacyl-[acyl-carrier-protein] synthase II
MNLQGRDVVITGLGPVTSIGLGCDAFWAALIEGRSGASPTALPVDVGRSVELPLAVMPPARQIPGLETHLDFLAGQGCAGYRDLGYTLLAAELALADAGLEVDREANDVGLVQAFEAPGMERTVSRLFELLATPMPPNGPPHVYDLLAPHFYNMQAFMYVHLMGKALGLHGFSTCVHNACTSGAFAIETAAQQIRAGRADVMVVAGGEAFDTAVRLEWFRRLDLYARDGRMAPFDTDATGFFVGEGAAAIVLESADSAARRGAEVYASYLAGGFAHQAWKQTVPDLHSARLRDVIRKAMTSAGVSPADLDLVVPHGAATYLGDGYETSCLEQALDGKAAKAVATTFKPYVGHLLAASGLIETVGALLAVKHQTVPATPNSRPQHTSFPGPLAATSTSQPVTTVLKLCTGFTGHDAALVFRKA